MTASPHPETWTLKALDEPEGTVYDIPPQGLTLGRDPANSVVIEAKHEGVSAHHVRLVIRDGDLWAEDLHSKNGTFSGGREISVRAMAHGDVLQLGPDGPRFAAVCSTGIEDTVSLPKKGLGMGRRRVGHETIQLVREKLGISGDVDQMLRRQRRRHTAMTMSLAALVVIVGVTGFWMVREKDGQMRLLVEQQQAKLQEVTESQRESWDNQSQRWNEAQVQWEQTRERLQGQREELEAHIRDLENRGQVAASELESLRNELGQTVETLDFFNPVNIEQSKLRSVERVEEAVVLIETRQRFRNEDTGQELFVVIDETGNETLNLNDEGQPLEEESTGSGFCFSEDGWILTNAHVVGKKEEAPPVRISPEILLTPSIRLQVVFSGQAFRHNATLVAWNAEDTADLALLKIEPFDSMPHLDGLDLERPSPARGTEVFLLGFPLGKRAMQQGDTMIASTFRGIVSRQVGAYLQVDAAVHPGASGGPVIDSHGNVIGVVVGMQVVDRVAGSSAIGYTIPIADVRSVWPPPNLTE